MSPIQNEIKSVNIVRILIVLLAPAIYVAAAFYLRSIAGPFWQWNLLDPAYFYLLDSLNVFAGRPPGHVAHPGVTVSTFGAVWLWFQSANLGTDAFVRQVLGSPEVYLDQLSSVYVLINAMALSALGFVAFRVFGAVIPALTCQLAPFMSTITIKHAILPKPEAMLVLVTMLMMTALVLSLRGPADGKLAVVFGLIAGFGVVTKITVAPIFLIPLFVLADRRAIAVYAVVSVAAMGVFFLPAAGELGTVVSWFVKVAKSAGAHGSGPDTILDMSAYPAALAKVLKRPALKVPMALAFLTLLAAAWQAKRGEPCNLLELRCLAGILTAQVIHVLLVAKQPTAFYLIPSYMMSSLSLLLSVRLLWSFRPASWRIPVSGGVLASLLVTGFAIGQVGGMNRLAGHFAETSKHASAIDSRAFRHCSRMFIYSASAPVFALFLADRVTGFHHVDELAKLYPGENFWIDDWLDQSKYVLRDWHGPRKFKAIRSKAECLFIRGNRPNGVRTFLRRVAPDLAYETRCTTGGETVATVNVGCQGKVSE